MERAQLPESEHRLLAALSGNELKARVRELVAAGWSMSSVGQACAPPRSRSTIRSWISVSSLSSSDSTIPAAKNSSFHSVHSVHPVPAAPAKNERYTPKRRNVMPSRSPGLTEVDKSHIKDLARLASRYRSTSSTSSTYGRANADFTLLVNSLYSRGVTVREIAAAAEVTYRAINRRITR